ncbi:HNH endonuclease [Streptomyces sp. NPDC006711]|uniref:HNH endonuclease n=1 Tax=Streptomyces sp. NPDC006711 TaxID=3364762 RepID=UPI0036C3C520
MTLVQPALDGSGSRSKRPVASLTGTTAHDESYRERTRDRIQAHSIPDIASDCWIWQKALDRDGYGVIQATKRDSAHRVAYLAFIGPIPEGLVLDHTCHSMDTTCPGGSDCLHRRCVNPAHLEPVPPGENTQRGVSPSALNARKTHCHRGHKFTPENTYARPDGRACRACQNAACAEYKRRKKGAH